MRLDRVASRDEFHVKRWQCPKGHWAREVWHGREIVSREHGDELGRMLTDEKLKRLAQTRLAGV